MKLKNLMLIISLVIIGCNKNEEDKLSNTDINQNDENNKKEVAMTNKEITTESGLKYIDIALGDGAMPETGDKVVVHYTGTLEDGTQFDTSIGRAPFSFPLGAGRVIKGWDEGVAGMKVGGKRKLTIPPELGYGSRGAGNVIPANATLIFEVELLKVN